MGVRVSLSGNSSMNVCDGLFGLGDFVLLRVVSTGLAHIYKELLVFNPITFIPSTFLITAVENRLRWINLLCF